MYMYLYVPTCTNACSYRRLVLSSQPEEFMNSNEERKSALKSNLLLERFKVYFKVCLVKIDRIELQVLKWYVHCTCTYVVVAPAHMYIFCHTGWGNHGWAEEGTCEDSLYYHSTARWDGSSATRTVMRPLCAAYDRTLLPYVPQQMTINQLHTVTSIWQILAYPSRVHGDNKSINQLNSVMCMWQCCTQQLLDFTLLYMYSCPFTPLYYVWRCTVTELYT